MNVKISVVTPEEKWNVKLENRITGQIRSEEGGFRYYPKNWNIGGDLFPSLGDVVRALDSDT